MYKVVIIGSMFDLMKALNTINECEGTLENIVNVNGQIAVVYREYPILKEKKTKKVE
jgi:hypothetical protein